MNTKILALGLLALGASGCRNTGKQASQLQNVGIAVPRAARITIDELPEILKTCKPDGLSLTLQVSAEMVRTASTSCRKTGNSTLILKP